MAEVAAARSSNRVPHHPDEMEAVVAAAREQLGHSVDALGRRTAEKARFRPRLRDDAGRLRREVPAAGAAAVLVAVLWVWRRRRRG